MLNMWAQFSNSSVWVSAVFLSLIVALQLSCRSGRTGPPDCYPCQAASLFLRSPVHIFKCCFPREGRDAACLRRAEKDTQRSRVALPAISQGLKYSRRRFCSGNMKGWSSYHLLCWHIQRDPPGEGQSSYTSLTSLDKHKKLISGKTVIWIQILLSTTCCLLPAIPEHNYMTMEENCNEFSSMHNFWIITIYYWFQLEKTEFLLLPDVNGEF